MSTRSGTAILRRLHRWTGFLLGFWVLIVSISGGALLFKDRYYQALHPRLAAPVSPAETAGYADVLRRLTEGEATSRPILIGFPRPGHNAFRLWFADGSEELADPATGEILGSRNWKDSLPRFLLELHAHLLTGKSGETANGIVAILLFFLLVTSPLVWWPRRRGSSIRHLVLRNPGRRELNRWHECMGLLTFVPILIVVATGIALVFFPTTSGLLSSLLDRQPPVKLEPLPGAPQALSPDWVRALDQVRSVLNSGEIIRCTLPSATNRALTFRVRMPGEHHPNGRSYLVIDPETTTVVQVIDARRLGPGNRLANLVYPLHSGKLQMGIYWIVVLTAAVGNVSLALSGLAGYLPGVLKSAFRSISAVFLK